MGILKRFKDIMSANVNAMLDKAEDPEKMIDQYLRDLESDLGKVKAETASVMAEESKAQRQVRENQESIEKMQRYAEKALLAGNENDARQFLTQKASLEEKQNLLYENLSIASQNAAQMRQMHDKLEKDIQELRQRKATIKVKMQTAKARERMNKLGESYGKAEGSMAAFDRMEEKANKMLDEANAMSELNAGKKEDIGSLMGKYDDATVGTDSAVDASLAEMKQRLGLS